MRAPLFICGVFVVGMIVGFLTCHSRLHVEVDYDKAHVELEVNE